MFHFEEIKRITYHNVFQDQLTSLLPCLDKRSKNSKIIGTIYNTMVMKEENDEKDAGDKGENRLVLQAITGGGKERSDDRKILAGGIDAVCKVVVVNWEKALLDKQYAPSTIDGKLAALDRFCCFVAGEIAGENT